MTAVDRAQKFLNESIREGRFPEGEWLPTMEEIAADVECSPHAVRRATRRLNEQGILRSVKRKGTQVLRKPGLGRALLMPSPDAHTNTLMLPAVEDALIRANIDLDCNPFLFRSHQRYQALRHGLMQSADDQVLICLGQERIAEDMRADWLKFSAAFRGCVCFQFEEIHLLPHAVTILPDPLAEAREVAAHLTQLGHRRIGIVAGGEPGDGSLADRRTAALRDILSLTDAEVFPFYYNVDSSQGVTEFVRTNRCTAWWAINDHQALGHMLDFLRDGLRIPEDLSVVGCNNTPWALQTDHPLTSLDLDIAAIADTIADTVKTLWTSATPKKEAKRSFVQAKLIARSSTGPAPSS